MSSWSATRRTVTGFTQALKSLVHTPTLKPALVPYAPTKPPAYLKTPSTIPTHHPLVITGGQSGFDGFLARKSRRLSNWPATDLVLKKIDSPASGRGVQRIFSLIFFLWTIWWLPHTQLTTPWQTLTSWIRYRVYLIIYGKLNKTLMLMFQKP